MIDITSEEQMLMEMDERIDSYLRGQMTKEEERQFLSDCENNKELKERAYMTALLAKSLRKQSMDSHWTQEQYEEWLEELYSKEPRFK